MNLGSVNDGWSAKTAGNECPVCHITFASTQSMVRHKSSVHEAKSSHVQCDICHKRYTQAWTLKAHRRTHFEKKPWKCWCGAGFSEKKYLTNHEKTKHGGGAFTCEHCDQEFGYAHVLRLHIKRKHQNKHSCEQCGETFKAGGDYRNHVISLHSDTEATKRLLDKWDRSLGLVPSENIVDNKEQAKDIEHGVEPSYLNRPNEITPEEDDGDEGSSFVQDKESMELEHGEPTHFKVVPEENADELEDDDVTEPDKGMDFGESIHFDRTPEIMPAEKDGKVNVADVKEPAREIEFGESTLPYSAGAPMNELKEKGRIFEDDLQKLTSTELKDDLVAKEIRQDFVNEMDVDADMCEFNDNSNAEENTTNDNLLGSSNKEDRVKDKDKETISQDGSLIFIPSLPLFLAQEDCNGLFPCDLCHRVLSFKDELRMHKLLEHEGLRFECSLCTSVFLSQLEMKRHKLSCSRSPVKKEKSEPTSLVCDLCGFVAKRPDALRQHKASKHDGISFKCDKCPKVFMQERNLKIHMRQIHESEPLLCDQCDYKTQREDTLKKHKMNMHGSPEKRNNLNKIECDACDFTTTRLDGLREHKLSVHQGIRYNCPQCAKTFTQERNMKMHVRMIHEKKTTLSCDQCDYTTSWKDSLHQHIKTKHEGVFFECPICLRALASSRQVQQHIKTVHN